MYRISCFVDVCDESRVLQLVVLPHGRIWVGGSRRCLYQGHRQYEVYTLQHSFGLAVLLKAWGV